MKVIVGLGNPGPEYALTRHNAGFLALDWRVGETGWSFQKKFNAFVNESQGCLFIKPQTFMNDSGRSVGAALDYYGLLPNNLSPETDFSDSLVVIHDDLDVDVGKFKIATDSRSAGHRGVESIIQRLKTKKFTRYRIGIRTADRGPIPTEKFVLQKFSKDELAAIKVAVALLPEF